MKQLLVEVIQQLLIYTNVDHLILGIQLLINEHTSSLPIKQNQLIGK